jgi:hypothetical protein
LFPIFLLIPAKPDPPKQPVPQEQELMLMAELLMLQIAKPEKNQMKGPALQRRQAEFAL